MKNEIILKLDLFFGDLTSSSVEEVSQEEISAFANEAALEKSFEDSNTL